MDWEKGAAGPVYALAAANTQLIGRQLAILIMDMVALNSNPDRIHLIGFSLGAHVAGYAGKALKRNHVEIGRITGETLGRLRLLTFHEFAKMFCSKIKTL